MLSLLRKLILEPQAGKDVPGLLAIIGAESNADEQDSQEDQEDQEDQEEEDSTEAQQSSSDHEASVAQQQSNTTTSTDTAQQQNQSGQNQTAASTMPRPAAPSYDRNCIIPASCRLNIQNSKLHNIYTELQRLDLQTYPNSAAITLRVFFDLTVEEYININKAIQINSRDSLSQKFNKVLTHLEQAGLLPHREADTLRRMATLDPSHPTLLSITNLHDYVHRLTYQPTPRELTIIWDNLQRLMEIIYQ